MQEFMTTVEPPDGRGCGEREPDMPYACCGVGPSGSPIESFVQDPVLPWIDETVGRGSQVLPRNPDDPNTLYDLVHIVGVNTSADKDGYPFYWDFVEESRHYGTSRKLSPDMPFEKLTPGPGGSRQVFVHRFAIPQFNFAVVRDRPYYMCRYQFPLAKWIGDDEFGHHRPVDESEPCAFAGKDLAWLFHDVEDIEQPGMPEQFRVKFGSTMYTGTYTAVPARADYSPPTFTHKSMWKPGIFLAVPMSHFEFRDSAPPELQERLNKIGFDAVVLDW